MRNRTRALAPFAAVLCIAAVAWPAAALAATLSLRTARAEVRHAASMSVRSRDASGFRIRSCRRLGPRHVHCVVVFRDVRRSGRTCTVTFSVSLRRANLATFAGRPVCSG